MKARRLPQRSSDSPVRKSLLNFTKQLRKMAKESADLPSANNDDKRILRDEAARLIRSVKSLIRIVETHDALVMWAAEVSRAARPDDEAMQRVLGKLSMLGPVVLNGLTDLQSALWAALSLGGHVLDNPITEKAAKKLREASTAPAREVRRTKSQQRLGEILKAAESIRTEHHNWKAPRIAAEIAKARVVDLKDNTIEKIVRKNLKQSRRA